MGDTKINLSSTEDLSKVIYSRKVQDKNQWSELFNIGLDKKLRGLREDLKCLTMNFNLM